MTVASRVRSGDPRSFRREVEGSLIWWVRLLTEVTGFSRNCLLESLSMPPRSASPTALSWSLRAGAAYDALFAFLLVAIPERIGSTFRLPLPGERFYLWLIAVFLSSLGVFYILVARNPAGLRAFLRLAIATRLAGAVVLGAAAVGRPDLGGLWLIAGGDLLFGATHLALSRSLGADPALRG